MCAALALACAATTTALATPSTAVTLRGTLVMVHQGPTMHYYLDVGGRMSRELTFATVPHFRPGAPLEVHGVGHGDTVAVTGVSRLVAAAAPAPSAIGTRNLLVILVKWTGSTLTTNQTAANDFVFSTTDPQRRSVTQWYDDVSYGQLTWIGVVTPVLTIAAPSGCDLTTIANRSDSAATAAGYTLGNYDNRMYDFPTDACGGSYGEVGGARSWIDDGLSDMSNGYQRMAPDHELGHNLGEWHGHGLDCGANTITSGCITAAAGASECEYGGTPPCVSEYGDAYDVMGNNWTGDNVGGVNWFGIWHEMQLGWVSGRTLTDNQPASAADHPFTIAPIESRTGDVGLTLNTSAGRKYVVEYRQPLSQDSFLTNYPAGTSGVQISMANPVSGFGADTGPANLDTTPNSAAFDAIHLYEDWFDAPLAVGQTYTDAGGFTLTLNSVAASGASVTVHWLGAPTVTTLDQMDPAVAYNGWRGVVDGAANGGSYRMSNTKGDTLTWKSPVGTSVNVVARTGPTFGNANVNIDGVNKGPLDLYAAAPGGLSHAYLGLTNAAHTVVIKVLGTKNVASTGTDVSLDAFVVGAATAQESAPAVVYDTWKNAKSANADGGSYRLASLASARASVTFTGTRIDWITVKGKAYGKAGVTIDGVAKGTVDLYAAATAWKSLVSYSGLSAGTHTMVIQVLGLKNVAATGTKVVVDGFKVHG